MEISQRTASLDDIEWLESFYESINSIGDSIGKFSE